MKTLSKYKSIQRKRKNLMIITPISLTQKYIHRNENNFAIPYSVGLAKLCKFKTYLGDLIFSENNVPEEKYNTLVSSNDFIKCIH